MSKEPKMAETSEDFIGAETLRKMKQAAQDFPATEYTNAGGWCKRCGCGNDILRYRHLPNCTNPTREVW